MEDATADPADFQNQMLIHQLDVPFSIRLSAIVTNKILFSWLPDTVWTGCSNWYRGMDDTEILWPLTQKEHRRMMGELRINDLDFAPLA